MDHTSNFVKHKTIKLLEDNRENLDDLADRKLFTYNTKSKIHERNNELHFTKMKDLLQKITSRE